MSHIGTLTERSLHAALKNYLQQPGDLFEQKLEGFVIDLLRGDLLIEIQTRNFSAMKRKLNKLLDAGYTIHLVHPIPAQKWIVRETAVGRRIGRRKSPKSGRAVDVFRELVRIPAILPHPNFNLEILLTHQEEVWRDDGQGSWRRKGWSVADQRLLDVVGSVMFAGKADYLNVLPPDLPRPFTNAELAKACKIPRPLAGKITYTLRQSGWLEKTGKKGRAYLFDVP